MLIQHKLTLESELRVQLLHIRERELDYFLHNLRTIAQLGMLLSGFGHSGLIYLKYIDFNLCGEQEFFCAEFTYPFTIILLIGCSLMTQWGCLLVMMLAPHMAIHGKTGSFSKSVDLTEREIQFSLRLAALSVFTFFLAATMWAFQSRRVSTAVLITTVILVSGYATREVVAFLHRVYGIDRKKLVTGKMQVGRRRRKRAGHDPLKGGHPHHHRQHYTLLNDEHPDPPSSTTTHSSTCTSQLHASEPAATRSPSANASQPRLPWYGQLQRTASRTVGVVERTARALNHTFLYNEEACMAQDPRIAPSAGSSRSRARTPRDRVRAQPPKLRPRPGSAHQTDSPLTEFDTDWQCRGEAQRVFSPTDVGGHVSAGRAAHTQGGAWTWWHSGGCGGATESAQGGQPLPSPSHVRAADVSSAREPCSSSLSAELNSASGYGATVATCAACEGSAHAGSSKAEAPPCQRCAQHGERCVGEAGARPEGGTRLTAVDEYDCSE